MQTCQIESTSLNNTLKIAEQIGRHLRGGEAIELMSDLGSGKTAFVRGLACGMGSSDTVRSPSFTLSNQYATDTLTLYHFDFYRLYEPGIMREELAELLLDPQAVVAIEWATIVADVLPAARLSVSIKTTGETSRSLNFSYPAGLAYLLGDM